MISFNKAPIIGSEITYIQAAAETPQLSGNGQFTRRCQEWIEQRMGNGSKVFLTTSCTSSLELAALLIDIKPGDEVILPSFTFVSSVNAFVLRGATPVMIDVEPGAMNIDHRLIEAAITPKTRAIVPVHYGGVACDMDIIMAIAKKHSLRVVEDAAPSLTATYDSKALGTIGHIGCFSFHETKNFTSGGQGGAIVINDKSLVGRAEIMYDNGTNRRQFFRGESKEYGWIDIGSNFVMSEIQAAYLWAQLEVADQITARRQQIWTRYYTALYALAESGTIRLPEACPRGVHNAHMFFIKLRDKQQRGAFAKYMKEADIICSPHYVPLHHRPIFHKLGKFVGEDIYTTTESDRLIRLPLYYDLNEMDQDAVIRGVWSFFGECEDNEASSRGSCIQGSEKLCERNVQTSGVNGHAPTQ